MQKNKSVKSLHVLKAVCAFFVVMIHSSAMYKNELMFLFQTAVPCFFAISGFFLYRGDSPEEVAKAVEWIKRSLITFFLLSILYGVFFHFWLGYGYSLYSLFYNLCIGCIPAWHLWYFVAFCHALILFVMLKKLNLWGVWIIPIGLIVHGLYVWYIFSEWGVGVSRMWLFFKPFYSAAYLSVGYFVAKYEWKKLSPSFFFAALCLSLPLLYYAEHHYQMHPFSFLCVCLEMCAVCSVISLCVRYKTVGYSFLEYIGKKHSANIYYYHMIVSYLLSSLFLRLLGVHIEPYSPFIVFPCSILFSMGIERLLLMLCACKS